jgi:hypothetical protein
VRCTRGHRCINESDTTGRCTPYALDDQLESRTCRAWTRRRGAVRGSVPNTCFQRKSLQEKFFVLIGPVESVHSPLELLVVRRGVVGMNSGPIGGCNGEACGRITDGSQPPTAHPQKTAFLHMLIHRCASLETTPEKKFSTDDSRGRRTRETPDGSSRSRVGPPGVGTRCVSASTAALFERSAPAPGRTPCAARTFPCESSCRRT